VRKETAVLESVSVESRRYLRMLACTLMCSFYFAKFYVELEEGSVIYIYIYIYIYIGLITDDAG